MSKYNEQHIAEVREVEPPRVRHLLIYYFLQGIGLSLFFTVSTSLFLSSFVSADLPMAYMASAVLLIVFGVIYDFAERRVAMYKRAFGLIAIAGVVLAFYAASSTITVAWLSFSMFVMCKIIFTISDLEFWGLSNLLFDTRDSKSLFGWINMRETPAKVIGYFSVGLLLPIMELQTLLLFSGVAFLLSFFVLRKLLDPRYAKEIKQPVIVKPTGGGRSLFKFPGATLLLLLCVLGIIGVIVFALINYSFLSLLEDRFHKASELATYIGLVFGVTSMLIAGGKTFMTNKVLPRIGAKVSMLALPAFIILVGALMMAGIGSGEERTLAYFVLFLAGGKMFKEVFYEPIFATLSQPLPTSVRRRAYTIVKGLAEPGGLALAAVIIHFAMGPDLHPDLNKANALLMGLAVGWAGLIFIAFQKYIVTFKGAIAKRVLVTRAIDSFNSFSQAIMREKLESRQPEEVIYAHELCSASNVHFFETEASRLLRHESGEVRKYALEKMSVNTPFSDTDVLIYLAVTDASIEVKELAIIHCGARYRDSFGEQYNSFLENPDLRIKQAAIKGLMESGNPEIIMIAGHKLNDLLASNEAAQNVIGATIIGDMHLNSHYRHLLKFFEHTEISVRKAAIVAAGKLTHPKLMSALFSLLSDRHQSDVVVKSLSNYQKDVINHLLENKGLLERYPDDILKLCGYIEEKIAAMIICMYLLPPAETELLDSCLQALYLNSVKVDVDRGILELKLVNTGALMYSSLYYMAQLPDSAALLKEAFTAEVRNAKRRMLLLLALMYDKQAFAKIIAAYDKAGDNKVSVTKMMEGVFDENHKKRFLPIFEAKTNTELEKHLAQFYPLQVKDDISEAVLMGKKKSIFLLWTQAAALYTYLLELSDDVLQMYKDHQEKMIFEMVQLALSRKPFALRLIEDESNASFTIDQEHDDALLNIEKIVVLKTIPIFENFTQPMLTAICDIMQEQRYSANGLLYGEGEPGNSMFIIYYGTVSMFNGVAEIMRQGGKEIIVKIDTQGQELASAKALTDTLLFRINKEDIDKLKVTQPEMAQSMLQMFSTV